MFAIKKIILLIVCATALSHNGMAQGTKEDYARANTIRDKMENNIYYNPKTFQWIAVQHKFWYLNITPNGKEYVLVDVDAKTRKPAFDQTRFGASLQQPGGKSIDPYRLPITITSFSENGKQVDFTWNDKSWVLDLDTYKTSMNTKQSQPIVTRTPGQADDLVGEPVKSPDRKWLAFIRNYNVYVQPFSINGEPIALSFDGSEGEYYSTNISWSPDSKKIATNKVRPNKPHLVYLVESSPTDQLQPKLHSRNYLKPGDALPQKQPSLFIIDSKKEFVVEPSSIKNQYNISNPVWRKDSRGFTFEYNQRGSQSYKVLEMNGNSGIVKELIDEGTKTFINNRKKFRYDLNDGKEIIWASERDGWNHLYLYDGQTGKVINQITKGDWVVRTVIKVDEANRTIIFEGSGREPGQDPYLVQLYKVNFDGSALKALTTENANHTTFFSADYDFFVDSYSRIDLPSITVLRSCDDGRILMELEKADDKDLLSTGWKAPEVFNCRGRDGATGIWGIIVRPSNFNPQKEIPGDRIHLRGAAQFVCSKEFCCRYARR